uniref:DNA repair protein recA 2, mitochondrial n=1 Tax=Anthurium amnicola TaxID=1678845 RepID=A0A1D1XNI6_9ARAE
MPGALPLRMRLPWPVSLAASASLLRAACSLRPCTLMRVRTRDEVNSFGLHGRCLSSTVEALLEYEKDQLYEDGKMVEKEAALQSALSQLSGDFDKESMLSMRRFFVSHYTPAISTGSLKLDLALGIGGLPKCRGELLKFTGKRHRAKQHLPFMLSRKPKKMEGIVHIWIWRIPWILHLLSR